MKLIRLFNTIKYLTFKQIFARVKLLLPKCIKQVSTFPEIRNHATRFYFIEKRTITINYLEFKFLNESHDLSITGWDNSKISKLWRYNLHYFDYLNQYELSEYLVEQQSNIIDDWIQKNHFGQGIGWEPYPTSIRIVNWIKWHWKTKSLKSNQLLSLWNQIRWLESNLEYHLLGNHLFVNAKALLFASAFFNINENSTLVKKSRKILFEELNEQFLNDGAHFELSPMYHSLGIEDLLDIINISRLFPFKLETNCIKDKISKGLLWLDSMKYGNFELAHFNDCANNISPLYNELINYSGLLNLSVAYNKQEYVHYFQNSGFVVVKVKQTHLIADVGRIGPNYLPGHSHADTLSFELAIKDYRVIVNSGTSLYDNTPLRLFQRGTSSHSTVVINDTNSSDVWSSFRVGKRAYPYDFYLNNSYFENCKISFGCSHSGYDKLKGKPKHLRDWIFDGTFWQIVDTISGHFDNAKLYFYLHPQIEIVILGGFIILEANNTKICEIEIWDLNNFYVENAFYYDEFGTSGIPSKLISFCVFQPGTYVTKIKFKFD